MKRLLIATHNQAKIKEIMFGLIPLKDKNIEIVTLNDVGVEEEPEETGKTIKENSEIKARFYANLTGLPSLADDGGFFIPYLHGEPGVKSNRWLGRKATDTELIAHTLKMMSGVPFGKRQAYLDLSLCFFDPSTKRLEFENEKIDGHISEIPYSHWIPGFPYRAVLIVDEFKKFYDELTPDEHEKVNHRLKALKRLTKRIRDLI